MVAAALLGAACSSSPPSATLSASPTPEDSGLSVEVPDPTTATDATPDPATATPSTEPSTVAPGPTAVEIVRGPIAAAAALAFAVGLADGVGMRIPGTAGDEAARSRIAAALLGAGWHVQPDIVALPQGGQTANLLATIDGQLPSGPMIVVGSHMDTLGGVGANDNASGVGVLIEVARELADEAPDFPIPVVLVAFAAEERQEAPGRPHHLGSEQLAAALGERTVAMLSVDMIGNGPTTLIVGMDGTDTTLVERIRAVAAKAGMADVETGSRGDISDHGPFARRGIPAAFLWTGPDGRLHTANDTTGHLDIDDIARAGALTLAFIRDLTPADAAGLQPNAS